MDTNTAPSSKTRLYASHFAADQLREAGDEQNIRARLAGMNSARHNIESCIEEEVRAWREAGASWADVGEALGLTRQGAQQRYSKRLY